MFPQKSKNRLNTSLGLNKVRANSAKGIDLGFSDDKLQ